MNTKSLLATIISILILVATAILAFTATNLDAGQNCYYSFAIECRYQGSASGTGGIVKPGMTFNEVSKICGPPEKHLAKWKERTQGNKKWYHYQKYLWIRKEWKKPLEFIFHNGRLQRICEDR